MADHPQFAHARKIDKGRPGGYPALDDDGNVIQPTGNVVLTAPNGTPYRLIVADDGTVSTEPS